MIVLPEKGLVILAAVEIALDEVVQICNTNADLYKLGADCGASRPVNPEGSCRAAKARLGGIEVEDDLGEVVEVAIVAGLGEIFGGGVVVADSEQFGERGNS